MTSRRLARFVALVAVALLVAACSSTAGTADETADGSGGELQATQWVLRSYASAGALTIVPDDQYADADFRSQRVKGFAGCNTYDAVYRNAARLLLITMPATTLMSCGEANDAFEASFLALLDQSRFYNVRVNTLTIRGPDGTVLLEFDAARRNPLLGSWLVDSYSTGPGAMVAPLEGTELTAVFRIAKVSGSGGCNSFEGPYTTNGSVAAIGPLATTRIACPEEVMAQEGAFLAALQGVGRVEPRGQTLFLQDLRGNNLVTLVRPAAAEASPEPSVAPSPSASLPPPSASPSAAPTPSPTTAPTPSPTAAASAFAGADHRTAGVRASDGDMRVDRPDGRDPRHDRLSRRLEHGGVAGDTRLPLLRPAADHGPGGPRDADDRGHDQSGPDRDVRGSAHRSHRSCCLERAEE